jgi:hypothetical protein
MYNMRIITLIKRKWILTPTACFFLSFFLISTAYAGAGQGASRLTGEEKGDSPPMETQRTTIVKKNAELVITHFGRQYVVSTATLIIDQNGRQTSIKKMRVPCDVDISYEIQKGGRHMMHQIKILKVHNGARDNMWRKPQ